MELERIFSKKIERKSFVVTIGTAAAVFVLMKSFIFNLFFSKKEKSTHKKKNRIKVKPNPLAVSREKLGKQNG